MARMGVARDGAASLGFFCVIVAALVVLGAPGTTAQDCSSYEEPDIFAYLGMGCPTAPPSPEEVQNEWFYCCEFFEPYLRNGPCAQQYMDDEIPSFFLQSVLDMFAACNLCIGYGWCPGAAPADDGARQCPTDLNPEPYRQARFFTPSFDGSPYAIVEADAGAFALVPHRTLSVAYGGWAALDGQPDVEEPIVVPYVTILSPYGSLPLTATDARLDGVPHPDAVSTASKLSVKGIAFMPEAWSGPDDAAANLFGDAMFVAWHLAPPADGVIGLEVTTTPVVTLVAAHGNEPLAAMSSIRLDAEAVLLRGADRVRVAVCDNRIGVAAYTKRTPPGGGGGDPIGVATVSVWSTSDAFTAAQAQLDAGAAPSVGPGSAWGTQEWPLLPDGADASDPPGADFSSGASSSYVAEITTFGGADPAARTLVADHQRPANARHDWPLFALGFRRDANTGQLHAWLTAFYVTTTGVHRLWLRQWCHSDADLHLATMDGPPWNENDSNGEDALDDAPPGYANGTAVDFTGHNFHALAAAEGVPAPCYLPTSIAFGGARDSVENTWFPVSGDLDPEFTVPRRLQPMQFVMTFMREANGDGDVSMQVVATSPLRAYFTRVDGPASAVWGLWGEHQTSDVAHSPDPGGNNHWYSFTYEAEGDFIDSGGDTTDSDLKVWRVNWSSDYTTDTSHHNAFKSQVHGRGLGTVNGTMLTLFHTSQVEMFPEYSSTDARKLPGVLAMDDERFKDVPWLGYLNCGVCGQREVSAGGTREPARVGDSDGNVNDGTVVQIKGAFGFEGQESTRDLYQCDFIRGGEVIHTTRHNAGGDRNTWCTLPLPWPHDAGPLEIRVTRQDDGIEACPFPEHLRDTNEVCEIIMEGRCPEYDGCSRGLFYWAPSATYMLAEWVSLSVTEGSVVGGRTLTIDGYGFPIAASGVRVGATFHEIDPPEGREALRVSTELVTPALRTQFTVLTPPWPLAGRARIVVELLRSHDTGDSTTESVVYGGPPDGDVFTFSPCGDGTTAVGGECVSCPRGSYCPAGDRLLCAPGTFNPEEGATSAAACRQCPPHSSSSHGAAAVELCQCEPGFLGLVTSDMDATARDTACATCPVGGQCPRGNVLYARPGYFRLPGANTVVECPEARACIGESPAAALLEIAANATARNGTGTSGGGDASESLAQLTADEAAAVLLGEGATATDLMCDWQRGHRGLLCASCRAGFTRPSSGGLCSPCAGTGWSIAFVVALFLGHCVVLAVYTMRTVTSGWKGKRGRWQLASKILVSHVQQASACLLLFKAQWPWYLSLPVYGDAVTAAQAPSMDFKCLDTGPIRAFFLENTLRLLIPMLSAIVVASSVYSGYVCRHRGDRQAARALAAEKDAHGDVGVSMDVDEVVDWRKHSQRLNGSHGGGGGAGAGAGGGVHVAKLVSVEDAEGVSTDDESPAPHHITVAGSGTNLLDRAQSKSAPGMVAMSRPASMPVLGGDDGGGGGDGDGGGGGGSALERKHSAWDMVHDAGEHLHMSAAARLGYFRHRQKWMQGDLLFGAITVVLYLLFAKATQAAVSLFVCTRVGDTDRLVADMDVECWGDEHMVWVLVLGLPALLFYPIGVPLGFFLVLRWHRHRAQLESAAERAAVRVRFRLLLSGYRETAWHWETQVMFRRALLFTLVALRDTIASGVKLFLMSAVLATSLMLTVTVHPIADTSVLYALRQRQRDIKAKHMRSAAATAAAFAGVHGSMSLASRSPANVTSVDEPGPATTGGGGGATSGGGESGGGGGRIGDAGAPFTLSLHSLGRGVGSAARVSPAMAVGGLRQSTSMATATGDDRLDHGLGGGADADGGDEDFATWTEWYVEFVSRNLNSLEIGSLALCMLIAVFAHMQTLEESTALPGATSRHWLLVFTDVLVALGMLVFTAALVVAVVVTFLHDRRKAKEHRAALLAAAGDEASGDAAAAAALAAGPAGLISGSVSEAGGSGSGGRGVGAGGGVTGVVTRDSDEELDTDEEEIQGISLPPSRRASVARRASVPSEDVRAADTPG